MKQNQATSLAHYEVYQELDGDEWRWRLVHANGNIIADSAEGYSSKAKALQGLDSVRANAGDAPVQIGDQGDNAE